MLKNAKNKLKRATYTKMFLLCKKIRMHFDARNVEWKIEILYTCRQFGRKAHEIVKKKRKTCAIAQ